MARTPSLDAHNRVLEAALELFVEKGIEATSMDALAAASGVSKATIYKHWPEGKEPLLMELMLLVVGIEGPVDEESTGDLFTDLARVLNDKPRNARPEDQKRLMPQMVAYSATHQEFGNAWRSRVMEEPRRRIRRIVTEAMVGGRVAADLDMELSFAMLLGPLMYRHIFGRGQNWIGRPKQESDAEVPEVLSDPVELGNSVAGAFCRAFEIRAI
ncbi:MAG TPA: TetR/AcrR family transcriptional regulator [Acidobacteriaceae bacterium]|jgi:AcrR family transcriptional regulator|nr:TetR/AcrR family transcriptional regulator [Acidobacteriaceae bacterium]